MTKREAERQTYQQNKTVKYHSVEWGDMVEQGWVTMTVDSMGYATMLFDGRKR